MKKAVYSAILEISASNLEKSLSAGYSVGPGSIGGSALREESLLKDEVVTTESEDKKKEKTKKSLSLLTREDLVKSLEAKGVSRDTAWKIVDYVFNKLK